MTARISQEEDTGFFAYKETNRTHVSLILAQSLEDLVDAESPRNLLKFRVTCDSGTGDSLVSHASTTDILTATDPARARAR